MPDGAAIHATDLKKYYGPTEALGGLALDVPRGSICGFLGKNGAGKTTTIKLLLGMARPSGGHARVLGLAADSPESSVEIRRRTAFVSEEKELYDYMTVDEIIRFTASFYPRWRGDLEQRYRQSFDLPSEARIKTLSRGTRTKVALLLALCRGAELLVLDEPTSGLDPSATESVLQALVSHAAGADATIFFSSHQIAEVEQIADRIAIIDRGRAVVEGGLDDLRERYQRVQLVFAGEAPDHAFDAAGAVRVWREGRVLTVLTGAGPEAVLEEARALRPSSTDVRPVSLKEIFLESVAAED